MHFKISIVNKQYFWQLLKDDGSAIGQAPHIYTNLDAAKKDIEAIKEWAKDADVRLPNQPEEKNLKSMF